MAEAFSNGGVSFHYGYVICEFLAQELDCSSGTGIVGVGLPLAMEAQAPIKVESSMALLAIDSTGKTSKKKHTVTQCASSGVGWSPFIGQELLSLT